MEGGPAIFDVEVSNNNEEEVRQNEQRGSLMHFHHMLAHLHYKTIMLMSKDSASRIALTDEMRVDCLANAQGKQTKSTQSRKGTGTNTRIDVIGGVICSDPKRPMTPREMLDNTYMVHFIDHAPTMQGVLGKKEGRRRAKVHGVFRTAVQLPLPRAEAEGRDEYQTLGVFCKDTAIARQVGDPRNQANNGKAKRMHRTVMSMV
ncbi:hypothetical protein PF005_g5291 [Phytophthora fragariae]|nr:hypothetical protein PF011_g4227 [Phytophthora fragariae]KAE9226006.1 hypothetical protein PF005_g5291 [Phytophthora fragariae]KAE9252159.1 hypothetical protein PF002_g3953 [Phytophthora fragariae]